MEDLTIRMGGIADPIATQLRKQKLKFEKEVIRRFQKEADAITLLRVQGYIPDTQHQKMQQKLFKAIQAHIQERNGVLGK